MVQLLQQNTKLQKSHLECKRPTNLLSELNATEIKDEWEVLETTCFNSEKNVIRAINNNSER